MRLRVSSPAMIAFSAALLAAYARLVFATCRVQVVGPTPAAMSQGPVLLALWHRDILAVPLMMRPNAAYPLAGLMSPSADGRLTRAVAQHFGIGAAVGSSSRLGMQGARALVKLARQGSSLFLTPDGPRGPAMMAKDGTTTLARLTGLPLIPCAVAQVSPCFTFPSWDAFRLPLPGAKFTLRYGPPLAKGASAAELSAALNALLDKTSPIA